MCKFKFIFVVSYVLANVEANAIPGKITCLTKTCVTEAAKLLGTIDENVSPCDDFYKFACGQWLHKSRLPEHKPRINRFDELQDDLNDQLRDLLSETDVRTESREFIKNTKKYFESCLNTNQLEKLGTAPLKNLLDDLGGWPLLKGKKRKDWKETHWTDIMLKLRSLGSDVSALFSISILTNLMDNTRRILYIDQPSFGLGSRDAVLKGNNDSSVKAYKQLLLKTALKLGVNSKDPESILDEMFTLETMLANHSMPKELRRNMTAIFNKLTIKELSELAPNINWIKILKNWVSDDITENEEIVVLDSPYIAWLNDFLPTMNNRRLADYIIWRVIKSKISSLNEEWLQLKDEYDTVVSGTKQRPPRWYKCLQSTLREFGIALSHIYIKNFFSDDNKEKALEMFSNVVKEFRRSLTVNTWMGDKTREEAMKKIDNMKLLVGYPNELMDESKISDFYRNLKVDELDYFGNNIKLDKWAEDMEFGKLRERVDPYDWRDLSEVAQVNAYYHPDKNLVVMPAGILQGVFFNKERPSYLNYGSIAYISGHEIIHGFDDGGRQFDSKGNLRNWWDNTTDYLYTEKAKCFIDQYDRYKVEEISQYINGINTQGENIADNGGILQSYRAYLDFVKQNGPETLLPALNYTTEQLFWISSAAQWCTKATNEYLKQQLMTDTHSSAKPRVNVVLSNSQEFAKDFNCPLGSAMNPGNKCTIW